MRKTNSSIKRTKWHKPYLEKNVFDLTCFLNVWPICQHGGEGCVHHTATSHQRASQVFLGAIMSFSFILHSGLDQIVISQLWSENVSSDMLSVCFLCVSSPQGVESSVSSVRQLSAVHWGRRLLDRHVCQYRSVAIEQPPPKKMIRWRQCQSE